MKKIWILILTFFSLQSVHRAPAFALPADDEDQNADATSKWGQTTRAHNAELYQRTSHVDPIQDTSFAQDANRAPASVASNGRNPAGAPVVAPADDAPAKAVIRNAVKNKVYQESAIIANDQGFFPSTIFVTQGIPVRLFVTGASARSQCFVMDSFGVRRQVKSQKIEEISFTPETPGTYTFHCPMNGSKGSVIVKDLDVGARMPASTQDANP